MKRPDYVIVGPNPRHHKPPNPGGQLTATTGLLAFAEEAGISLAFIDTLQGSFPPPPIYMRLVKLGWRVMQLAWYSTASRPRVGMIFFSAGPISFLEKGFMAKAASFFNIKTLTCLRSGHLMPYLSSRSVMGKIIRLVLRLQAKILVQGNSWLPYLEHAGVEKKKTRVVANWLAPGKLLSDQPRVVRSMASVRFIFVGWVVKEKGLYELISACEALRYQGKPFHLLLVGGGTLESEILQRVETSGLERALRLTGWVAPDEVATLLDSSDVFVLPSHFEGFPNALIEAMAHGLPVISTTVGAIPDTVVDAYNGFLVAPTDEVGLANAMQRYIDNPRLITEHSAHALQTVAERHDLRRNCSALLGLLKT